MNSDKRIYWILIFLIIGSYVWIGYHLSHTESQSSGTLCLFKTATGIPCPSCGITRSLMLLISGDISGALWINPLGILAALLLITIPVWIIFDLSTKKYSMLVVYKQSEKIIRTKKIIYVPLIALLTLNWIWNISKGL
jgi:hypothetical protein